MFRAGLILIRRLLIASSLLILIVCGAEVGVRAYEAVTGRSISGPPEQLPADVSQLVVPSWHFYQELKPLAISQVECRDLHTKIELKTNSLGLRGTEIKTPKPSDCYRIIVLGDETIFAPETAEEDHFCSQLKQQLQRCSQKQIEVINAGVPGHCPLTEFILFKKLLLNLQPDLVLLHFDWSDIVDDRQIRRLAQCDEAGIPQSCTHPRLSHPKMKHAPQEVCRQHFRLVDWGLSLVSKEWKQQLARQKATSRDYNTNSYAWLRDDHPEENLAFRHAVRPIAELARTCQSWGIQLVVLTSPKPWQISARCSRGEGVRTAAGVAREAYYPNRAPFQVLGKITQRLKLPYIDGSAILVSGKEGELNFLKHAPRWSPQGHRCMANGVAKYLVQNGPGPWDAGRSESNTMPLLTSPIRDTEIRRVDGQPSDHQWPNRNAPEFEAPRR